MLLERFLILIHAFYLHQQLLSLVVLGLFLSLTMEACMFLLPRKSRKTALNPSGVKTGIVTCAILPDRVGQVRCRGSWWSARCLEPVHIQPEEIVQIIDQVSPTTLVVKPIASLTDLD